MMGRRGQFGVGLGLALALALSGSSLVFGAGLVAPSLGHCLYTSTNADVALIPVEGVPTDVEALDVYVGATAMGTMSLYQLYPVDLISWRDSNTYADLYVSGFSDTSTNFVAVSYEVGGVWSALSNVRDLEGVEPVWIENWYSLESWLATEFTVDPQASDALSGAVGSVESAVGITTVSREASNVQALADEGSLTSFSDVSALGLPEMTIFSTSYDPGFSTVASTQFGAVPSTITVQYLSVADMAQYTFFAQLRTVMEALMWLTFAVWLVGKFVPMFKV